MKSVFFRGVFCRWFIALTLVGLLTFSVSGAAAAFKNIKVGDKALPVQLHHFKIASRGTVFQTHNIGMFRQTCNQVEG